MQPGERVRLAVRRRDDRDPGRPEVHGDGHDGRAHRGHARALVQAAAAGRRRGGGAAGGTGPIADQPIRTLSGEPTTLAEHAGKALLIVNVASKCGLTPHYEGLQRLHERYADARASPSSGSRATSSAARSRAPHEEIAEFCSTSYSVTFPVYEKIDVNGARRHPIFATLTAAPDAEGTAGEVQWNFEKFVVAPDGEVVAQVPSADRPRSPRAGGRHRRRPSPTGDLMYEQRLLIDGKLVDAEGGRDLRQRQPGHRGGARPGRRRLRRRHAAGGRRGPHRVRHHRLVDRPRRPQGGHPAAAGGDRGRGRGPPVRAGLRGRLPGAHHLRPAARRAAQGGAALAGRADRHVRVVAVAGLRRTPSGTATSPSARSGRSRSASSA